MASRSRRRICTEFVSWVAFLIEISAAFRWVRLLNWMSSAALVMETVRLRFHYRRISALGSHETMAVLCTQYMMMEGRYPLSAGNRHIQIFYSVVEMH